MRRHVRRVEPYPLPLPLNPTPTPTPQPYPLTLTLTLTLNPNRDQVQLLLCNTLGGGGEAAEDAEGTPVDGGRLNGKGSHRRSGRG